MDMIMVWLAPMLQGLIQAFFTAIFGGWFEESAEEVAVVLSQVVTVFA